MKYSILAGIIALSILTSCEKDNEIAHPDPKGFMDFIKSQTDDLYAVCIYYGEEEVGFYWNSPEEYCNDPYGSCDTTLVFYEPDSLRIEHSIFFIGGFHNMVARDYAIRKTIYVPYENIIGITDSAPHGLIYKPLTAETKFMDIDELLWSCRGRRIIAVYVNENRDNWVHDEETIQY